MDSHVERIQALFSARTPDGVPGLAPLDEAAGEEMEAEPVGFEEVGDCVVVAGRIRIRREEGSLTDSQVTWIYRFDGDEVVAAKAFPGRLTAEESAELCEQL